MKQKHSMVDRSLNYGAKDIYMKESPGSFTIAKRHKNQNDGNLSFDTPRGGKGRLLSSHKSEVDFILGQKGGRPSAMSIEPASYSQRKTSMGALLPSQIREQASIEVQREIEAGNLKAIDYYGLYTPNF